MPIVGGGKRDGRAASMRLCSILLGVALFIPWLVEAQQQHKHGLLHDAHHDVIVAPDKGLSKLEATRLSDEHRSQRIETPIMSQRRKSTLNNSNVKNDASAIATLAPVATTTRRAPGLPRQKSSETAGLSTPQSARSLEDWEVEDFVLLATVDGKLYARDRKTGQERWAVEADTPMVETIYFRRDNQSNIKNEYHRYDDWLWIVEPSRDGSLFMYTPRGPVPGLVNTHLTMKKLVEEMSPYANEDPPILYTGEKRTTMVTLDARNGKVLKWFGSAAADNNAASCLNTPGLLDPDNVECSSSGTITLGRIEYIVSIHDKDNGLRIATLKYTEWSPNNFDDDLQRQYRTTLDSKYIYSSHDGGIIGYDHSPSQSSGRQFMQQKFPSPVVRVFDVARPWGTEDNDPKLVILPQPIPPFDDEDVGATDRSNQIFLNHTEAGSWYAMSGVKYPMAVTGLKRAQGSNPSWWTDKKDKAMTQDELSTALVGLHTLDIASAGNDNLLALPASVEDDETVNSTTDMLPVDQDVSSVVQAVKSIPESLMRALLDFFVNPIWILIFIAIVTLNFSKVDMWPRLQGKSTDLNIASTALNKTVEADAELNGSIENANEAENNGAQVVTINKTPTDLVHPSATGEQEPVLVKPSDPLEKVPDAANGTPHDPNVETPQKDKKKTHRGRRGGLRHKKPKSSSDDGIKVKSQTNIDDAVQTAKKLGEQQPQIEPDVHTINNGVAEVSGPILRMGSLICNTDKLIGTGSNGTMVFEGEFDGRPVAVKRMLIQFFDIASQETKLLRESDDHPNVIRYFAQQSRDGFLYIALELCPASLADVIEKPHLHRDLAHSGERDLPAVLYQITNGLQHLHALRIVHRDLKPQNILIAQGKDSKPRLLVSDFGLCKKLEGEQSSFRATTAHAAGTSGWRAPELLLDDDNDQTHVLDTSTHSGSGPLMNGVLMPSRRATRAIDIFSLGLVFFYVLTKGCHPFDCGGRYLREVNIRKNIFDLSQLEVLGDYSYEAKDLISSMLEPEPKRRPIARQVMAHPFFWPAKKRLNFLCDVSDHFEKEPRDPPSASLVELERNAVEVCRGDFLKPLGKEFVDSLGKQRKYTSIRLLDLLRALRNKKNHYEDMTDQLKKHVGPLPDGYLSFWTRKFPNLLITCWNIVYEVRWDETDRFREYYEPAGL